MRYLNKIILINSANINYAEIKLDGSVILNGNQGAGKSTILRAILFFYTGEKKKGLGIDPGGSSFEEFYLKHSDSYVAYEVVRDQFVYTVLVFKHQGHATFRFIDAPYDITWIRETDNSIRDWPAIQRNLNCHFSSYVTTIEQYKSIIYGGITKGDLSQYSLFEGANYDSIPRAIQNVFLNGKIDAEFIKSSLIDSLNLTAELDIDIFRRSLNKFNSDLKDTRTWFRQNPKTKEFPVQKQAGLVVENYLRVCSLDAQLLELWKELNYALPAAEDKVIELDVEMHKYEGQKQKAEKKLNDLKKRHTDELAKVKGEVFSLSKELEECRRLRKMYAEKQIDDLLKLKGQEEVLKLDLHSQQTILSTLQQEVSDIRERYDNLERQLQNRLQDLLSRISQQETLIGQTQLEEKNSALEQKTKALAEIESSYSATFAQLRESIDLKNGELSELNLQESLLLFRRPYKQQIEEKEADIQLSINKRKEVEVNRSGLEGQILLMQNERDFKVEKLDHDHTARLAVLNNQLAAINQDISTVASLLDKWNDTFYKWLDDNRPGWNETIGRVVDDVRVLYSTELNPSLSDTGNDVSLYGVQIDLSAIEPHASSAQELSDRLSNLKRNLLAKQNEIDAVEKDYKQQNDMLRKEYVKKIESLKQQLVDSALQLNVLESKITTLKGEKAKYVQLEEEEIAQKKQQLRSQIDTLSQHIRETKNRLEAARKRCDKEKAEVEKLYRSSIAQTQKLYDSQKKDLDSQRTAIQHQIDDQKKQLCSQRDAEYQNHGVDVESIRKQDGIIRDIEDKLSRIDSSRDLLAEYRINKERYLDKENDNVIHLNSLRNRESNMEDSYNREETTLRKEIEKLAELHRQAVNNYESLNLAIEKAHKCQENDSSIPSKVKMVFERLSTTKDCSTLVDEIHSNISSSHNALSSLRGNAGKFMDHFGDDNLYKFKKVLMSNEDFLDFGKNMFDFIENNIAENFRIELNDHYAGIMSKIAREVGILTEGESTVSRLLMDINKDFEGKRFVQAIKSIELRKSSNDSPLMELLKKLQQFFYENQESLGERNLFSGDDRDKVNAKAIQYLMDVYSLLLKCPDKDKLTLQDTFQLEFRINENGNESPWVSKLNRIGSNGTDILVKTLINIMLISVFKSRSSRRNNNFTLHCVMDEIGTLFPSNVKGLIQFAAERGIYLINGAPMSFNTTNYHYSYVVSKDANNISKVTLLLNNHNSYGPNTQ